MTPDEAILLSRSEDSTIPADLLIPTSAANYPYGRIDSWLADGFDGQAMTFQVADGECPTDETGLELIREKAETSGDGWTRSLTEAALTELGPANHPAIRATVVATSDKSTQPIKSLVWFVPSGGNTLVVSFRAWEGDFEAAAPIFQAASATMAFASEAQGSPSLGGKLIYPIFVGALVGVLLMVLRHRQRQAD